jgi:hypothetical protein
MDWKIMRSIDDMSQFAFYNYLGYGLGQDISGGAH